ncbi:PGF-CTERM sorting domain-containing protein [Haloterrigena salifodinae]|uniref:PGF-CTERM sorting domain-containing protein n=1 Tax=Haloterrigena salifodinae TaxID=2675099 RepID=A0A8T8DWC6_9EURY|nr:PGF-CTERM sorting domain-containing protein [Haloterrigena salifodinae]
MDNRQRRGRPRRGAAAHGRSRSRTAHLEEDGDGMPGFGVTVAIATLLSIALLWSRN